MTDVKEMGTLYTKEMLQLVSYAFQWELSERNIQRFELLTKNSWNYGSFDEQGKLASQVMATPFSVDFFGQIYKMAGIGFVASYPEYRSQGRIDRIMKQLLQDCKERGAVLSYLAPFSYPFYRRYGYELLFERIAYESNAAQWPDSPKTEGQVKRVTWEQGKDAIKQIFQKLPRHHRGGVVREDWWLEFKFPLRKDYTYALYQHEEETEGYLIYQIQEGKLTVYEWVSLTGRAYQGLNRMIASHNGSVYTIVYEEGFDGTDRQFLAATPLEKVSVRPEMMGRVVDVAAFLADYPFLDRLQEDIALVIETDVYAPWNTGVYELRRQGNDVTVTKTTETSLPKITLSIQRFTQLMMGSHTPDQLAFYGLLNGDTKAIDAVKEITPKQRPILEDYF
ncbi:GNAT family N-acetyltransferase [Enterococcus mediterraneensis]|uniref:GNAT family N-acetyltransferase n=1 Tax=Enterococcus mediterraneensis TaxID=2364791 RepID=UPI000F04B17B|nr:GNAT family N-acetyltransferase [Enterococcus mediterraneensis]